MPTQKRRLNLALTEKEILGLEKAMARFPIVGRKVSEAAHFAIEWFLSDAETISNLREFLNHYSAKIEKGKRT